MTIAAGSLNTLIRVRERTSTRDVLGQLVGGWADPPLWEGWGFVKGATGMAVASQSSPTDGVAKELNSYSVRLRYRTGIFDNGMQVELVDAGIKMLVKQVRYDIAGREWVDLVCEAGND